MNLLLAGSLIALMCGADVDQGKLLREIRWSELKESGQLKVGRIETGGAAVQGEVLVIENSESSPMTAALLSLPDPGITTTQYALTGSVSYEDVAGTGYLEMWNHFPGGGMFFSRTLGHSGPLGYLQGSHDWRPFTLPFFSDDETGPPNKLEFNLVLPESGTVRLSSVQLREYPEGFDPTLSPGAWWGERDAGWIGGIIGCVCGCLGGLIGVLAGLGKARGAVIFLCIGMIVCGVVCLAAGVTAWCISQPYAVYYPLLLCGIILTAVVGGNLPGIFRRYREIELRRMTSMDVDPAGA